MFRKEMSNLKSSDADFIKILRVTEKRKSTRKNEHLLSENLKKTSHSVVTSKGNDTTPKPGHGSSSKVSQASKTPSHRQPNTSVSRTKTKPTSSNSFIKPTQSSVGKSEKKTISVPSVSGKLLKKKQASTSYKEKYVAKKNSVSSSRRLTSSASDKLKKHSTSSVEVSSSAGSSHPTAKASHASIATSFPNASLRTGDNVSSKSLSSSSVHSKPSQKQPRAHAEHTTASKQKAHAKRPSSGHRKSTSQLDNSSVKAVSEEDLKVRQKQQTASNLSQHPSKRLAKPNSASKTKVLAQQHPGPLCETKPASKSSPPTAIVSPVQDRQVPVENVPQRTATLEEEQFVSSSNLDKQPDNSSSPSTNRKIPEVFMNDKNSLTSDDAKMRKPITEISKAQARGIGKNIKLGHDFQFHELKEWVNWCDACGRVILTLFGKCVSCTKCNMVCHGKCALSVSLTCEADQEIRSLTLTGTASRFAGTVTQVDTDESTLKEFNTMQRVFSIEEVQEKIEEFNGTVKGSQQMTLQDDGNTFRGFVRVAMNLSRPVSVIDNSSKTMHIPSVPQHKASFYIDKGATKALHLTSDSTSQEVVESLLIKFKITDNPMKFALYERQAREEGHVVLRKMLPKERPLLLRLLWGNGESDKRSFILQENESRGVDWESFSVAELHMFIKILDKEENDYIDQIKRKYEHRSQDLIKAIDYQTKLA